MTHGALASWLDRTWYRPHATMAVLALAPLALAFRTVVVARRAAYRHGILRVSRIDVPVVVVGNVSVGGTGKTPVVIALAEALRTRGRVPGVVSRGYGRRTRETRTVRPEDSARDVGDEPLLMARRGIAVAVGRRRADAARELLEAHPECDVVIADDGLQHHALARDVEIAVVDGTRAFGNGRLLPAGPLREPSARLREVDAVVLADPAPGLALDMPNAFTSHLRPEAFVPVRGPARALPTDAFAGRRAHALAGIGHPERFFRTLRDLGIDIVPRAFADHHAFGSYDLPAGADVILMTEKDAVKCEPFADPRCFYLRVGAELDPALLALVEQRIVAPR